GPLCLTCDIEFGPGRAVPAAFWFQSPFAKWSKATVISGVCSACFARAGCVDRILAGMRQRIPDLQVMPATTQERRQSVVQTMTSTIHHTLAQMETTTPDRVMGDG